MRALRVAASGRSARFTRTHERRSAVWMPTHATEWCAPATRRPACPSAVILPLNSDGGEGVGSPPSSTAAGMMVPS